MNLEGDLEILELNVKLREISGGPHLAWASTFVPYARTRLGRYSNELGFYENPEGENWDIKDTFFEKSVMRFLKEHVGPNLKAIKDNSNIWLSEKELEMYRRRNAELRRHFNVFVYLKNGHEFARKYLLNDIYNFEFLGSMIRDWSNITKIDEVNLYNDISPYLKNDEQKNSLKELAPYFLSVPNSREFANRFFEYSLNKGTTMKTLSETARHHLYDHVVYQVIDSANFVPTATTLG